MLKKRILGTFCASLVLFAALAARAVWGVDAKPAEAPAAPKASPSRIVHVTVYPDSALVTREVDVPPGAGLQELVVTPLPPHTVNSSLYSEGTDGIRVLATRFRTRPIREDTREEVRKLDDEAAKLQLAAQKLQADIKANEANAAFLAKLETFAAASTTHATEKGKLDSDQTIALAKYLIDGRSERSKELVNLQQQQQANQEQMQFVQRKRAELAGGTSRTERDAVIVVDKANAGGGKVRLNYLVSAAAWRPHYKFRAGKDAKANVQLEYLAAVMQQTGEDWTNVDLTLSTAQPMLNASPPELRTLAVRIIPKTTAPQSVLANTIPVPNPPGQGQFGNLGVGGGQLGIQGGFAGGQSSAQPMNQRRTFNNPKANASAKDYEAAAQELRQQAQIDLTNNDVSVGEEILNYAGAIEQARDLLAGESKPLAKGMPMRSGRNEGPSVTYHLAARHSVPSRNDEQVIEVSRLDMTPEYYYKAVPVLTAHVYRQANLTNKSKFVLLPGDATMYAGNDFVGRMNLPLVAVGETFTIGFGTEPQLQIHRQMTDKSRSMQGGNQVLKYEYRILISSYKSEKVKLQVWDRLPHAETETLGVSLVKATPEMSKDPMYLREDKPNNLLRWDLEVEPETNGEKAVTLQYEFKLELDRQMTIGSFQSKEAQRR